MEILQILLHKTLKKKPLSNFLILLIELPFNRKSKLRQKIKYF